MELDAVELEADRTRVVETLKQHLPCVDLDLFDLCRRALHPAASAWSRYRAARALRERLSPFARRPRLAAVVVAFGDRARALIDHRPPEGKRLAGGGVVALLGGDGAGKTTCARELRKWLATELATLHAHLGRPPRASLTYLVGVCLKLSAKLDRLRRRKPTTQSAGLTDYLFLFRHLCTARDRYRLYRRAHRFAAAGGVVIAERYPVPINHFLAGPSAAQGLGTRVDDRWTRLLRKIETRYYDLMLPPDTSIVLKLQPDTAVRRKPEEPPEYVRTRAR